MKTHTLASTLSYSASIVQQLCYVGVVVFGVYRISEGAMTVGGDAGWYGLGPVSVWPESQSRGIGQSLIRHGLETLRQIGAKGCVLIGDPAYYSRFGFVADPTVSYGDIPPEYVQRLAFGQHMARGEIVYHAGFGAS